MALTIMVSVFFIMYNLSRQGGKKQCFKTIILIRLM